MTTRFLHLHSSELIAGVLSILLATVLAGFGMVMLHVLGLGWLASLWFFSVFVLGLVVTDLLLAKLEPRLRAYKAIVVFSMLSVVLVCCAWRLNQNISVFELALYLLFTGVAFGFSLSAFRGQRTSRHQWMLALGVLGLLIFGFGLNAIVAKDFVPRASRLESALSLDELAQLEVLNLHPQLLGLNLNALKTQLRVNLKTQLNNFGLALKNNRDAQKTLLEDPSTPADWRDILERGGLKGVTEIHFLKQKINLEKAFRDEDPNAIRELLLGSEIPAWVRSDLERGGLKDWVHRQFDRQRLTIEKAIQDSDPTAIKVLLKNPQTRPELRTLLKRGGVRAGIQTRLANLRLALKKAIQTGDAQAVSLVYQHPFTPKSIREIFTEGALQPQIKLELATDENLLIDGFLKADPGAVKQLKLLGLAAKTNLPADFTVPSQAKESRTQIAIKQLLKTAPTIRADFLRRRTLLTRAIENNDPEAIKTLCPDCLIPSTPTPATSSGPIAMPQKPIQTKALEPLQLPDSLKIYLQNGGVRNGIAAKYTALYQVLVNAINSGDMTKVLGLLENPNIPSEVETWITKLNLTDIDTGEARASSLEKVKSILDGLAQTQTKSAVLAALEVANQTLPPLEVSELEGMIAKQVIDTALNKALPTFDAAASKIQTRAVDVALQGALIALTVNEKAAGNAAVQTLINRAQTELTHQAPKTIKTIFANTIKTAHDDSQIRRQKLEQVIDLLFQAQKETFVLVLRKSFALLALIALFAAGFAFVGSRARTSNSFKLGR